MTDRRRFLQTGSALAFGLTALPGLARGALAEEADEKGGDTGGFSLGVQSYTFRNFDLEQCLLRTRDLGLHGIEFYQKHAPLTDDPKKVAALLKLCKEYGVRPRAWGVQHFGKDADANRKVFEFGKAIGVKMFSASPTADAFDGLDKLCDEYKIAIGIHPHGPVGGGKLDPWYSAEIILAAVKDHHPLVGACLDTGHLIRSAQLGKKLDPAEQVRVLGARNFGMHFKDHDNKRQTDVILGKAVLDVPAVLKALKDVKFKGMISIEYEAKPEDPTADVRECVAVVRGAAKRLG